jgi:hypothetical protein
MFLGLQDPDPDPLVRDNPDPHVFWAYRIRPDSFVRGMDTVTDTDPGPGPEPSFFKR